MSDRFRPLETERLARWMDNELAAAGSIFGIPRELFFIPSAGDRFRLKVRDRELDTPIGVAAGPHTQLAQNIIVAWLCGARIIELKTVQILDRIDVSKPCIDMQDAGYNIEWSQELSIEESFTQYLAAWVLIHVLHHHLGLPGDRPGVLFDVSVGYDLDGIRQPAMCRFLERMIDAGEHLHECLDVASRTFPAVRDLEVSPRIAASATLSTLHGCPPEEIGAIAEHLMETWNLHTAVKLNPTLLGYDTVREILHHDLGWTDVEPSRSAFDTDIGFDDALDLLRGLSDIGARHGREFGIKLCNTLPVVNRRRTFDAAEDTAYLSGRPLHAVAVELANLLGENLPQRTRMSFAGGADAFNTTTLLTAGLRPVTTCSDVLRPGGYLRLRQYLTEINATMTAVGATDLDDLVRRTANGNVAIRDAARRNLARYAASLRSDPALARASYRRDHTKTRRCLGFFDCVEAPCTDACGVNQRVPEYMRRVAAGDVRGAAEVIWADNPLPSILGRACHHPCEPVCLRTHLDEPLAIREIKRFVTDTARPAKLSAALAASAPQVAIVGGGPCGLSAAVHLARAGARVTIFEARHESGGMVSATIPGYRAAPDAIRRDLEDVESLGVDTVFGTVVGEDLPLDELFARGFGHIVVAVGAQRGIRLGLEHEDVPGVHDGLDFLRSVRCGGAHDLGSRVAVIGGGDVAMDCARTARRLGCDEVQIVYRRSVEHMPAHPEEVDDLLVEGITIRELVAPRRIVVSDGRLEALECTEMTLGAPDGSGRPRPVEKEGSSLVIELDSLIVAVGQRTDLSVFGSSAVDTTPAGYVVVDRHTMESSVANVYVGGDLAEPGPSNIVDACGDGHRIARSIIERTGLRRLEPVGPPASPADTVDLLRRRSRRQPRVDIPVSAASDRDRFVEVIRTLDPDQAILEAARCLDCDRHCSTCEGVCPNRAIMTYHQEPWQADLSTICRSHDGGLETAVPTVAWRVAQRPQVAVLSDLCNECGNCATFCPTAGEPWRDKPRLYFHRADFKAETDNAFMIFEIDGGLAIQGRFDGRVHRLVDSGDVIYDHPAYRARLRRNDLRIVDLTARREAVKSVNLSLEPCAIMLTLLRGMTGSMAHLPFPEADPAWLIGADEG